MGFFKGKMRLGVHMMARKEGADMGEFRPLFGNGRGDDQADNFLEVVEFGAVLWRGNIQKFSSK